MIQPPPFTPTIVKIVPPPTQQVGVIDVMLGSLGLTGVIVLGSIVLGAGLGALFIAYRKWRENRTDANGGTSATTLNLSPPAR